MLKENTPKNKIVQPNLFKFLVGITILSVVSLVVISYRYDVNDERFTYHHMFENNDTVIDDPLIIGVIEEHHEALGFWLEGVKKSILPKTGITVVHIDAHSDMALPTSGGDFPFTIPKSYSKIIQQVDIGSYLAPLMYCGLIDTVIWIRPNWPTERFNFPVGNYKFDLGKRTMRKDSPPLARDLCIKNNVSNPKYDFGWFAECVVKPKWPRRNLNLKVMYLEDALNNLHFKKETPVILDIDEDFFSTGDPDLFQMQYTWNLNMQAFVDIGNLFEENNLCKKNEESIDSFDEILEKLLKQKLNIDFNQFDNILDILNSDQIFPFNSKKLLKIINNNWCGKLDLLDVLKKSQNIVNENYIDFYTLFNELELNFDFQNCSKYSYEWNIFGLCGVDNPTHRSNKIEITENIKSLEGYTHFDLYSFIENSVLNTLKKEFSQNIPVKYSKRAKITNEKKCILNSIDECYSLIKDNPKLGKYEKLGIK